MHILFLTDNFPPEVNAPASRTHEHAREWVRLGHKVTIITGVPNFPKGKIYKGYKNKIWDFEDIDGIQILRVWTYITSNDGFAKRILDYLSFMITSFIASFFVNKVDIIIGTSPQFFTVVSAWMVSVFKRKPFVFELRDLWPESIRAVDAIKNNKLLKWLEKIELFLYHRADIIISVTNSFKTNLESRGIKKSKIYVVTNGVDLERFKKIPRDPYLLKKYNLKDFFVIGYIGTHGLAHALQTVLEAAEKINKTKRLHKIIFIFIGDGAMKKYLIETAQEKKLDNVIFLDSVLKENVVRYWSLLDASIVHLRKTKLFKTVIPSKIFESMAMSVPLILGTKGESAEIVKKTGTGILFEPENSEDLVKKIIILKEDKILKSRFELNCKETHIKYERNKLAKDMLNILLKLVENNEIKK